MNKIIKYWHFTPLNPLKGRIATKYDRMTFGATTPMMGQWVLNRYLSEN